LVLPAMCCQALAVLWCSLVLSSLLAKNGASFKLGAGLLIPKRKTVVLIPNKPRWLVISGKFPPFCFPSSLHVTKTGFKQDFKTGMVHQSYSSCVMHCISELAGKLFLCPPSLASAGACSCSAFLLDLLFFDFRFVCAPFPQARRVFSKGQPRARGHSLFSV